MDGRPTWTDCDEAGDYAVPNVLSPRDLVFRPDKMDETVPHTHTCCILVITSDIFTHGLKSSRIKYTWHQLRLEGKK